MKSAIYNRGHSAFLRGLSRRSPSLEPENHPKNPVARKRRPNELWKPLPLQQRLRGNGPQRAKLATRRYANLFKKRGGKVFREYKHIKWALKEIFG